MRKYLVPRHFINGEGTYEEYSRGIDDIARAIQISQEGDLGFEFGLKLTVDTEKVGKELQARITDDMRRLPEGTWLLYDPKDRGPGTSYAQILFNPTFSIEPSIVISSDLDQYVINTAESLERLLELVQRVETDDALYATGSRDVPVVCATNQRNSDLRIIHELIHSSVIGSEKLRVGEERTNVTPAYAEIGESTSGLYILNASHQMYPELARSILQSSQRAKMCGFAMDYYVAIKSAQLGNIAKGYVASKENKFYAQRDEEEELESVKRLISGQTQQLGRTDIRDALATGLSDVRIQRIADFYPEKEVELVRGWMKESLK